MNQIVCEKLQQAVGILAEQDVDLWITFVRETSLTHDPCLDLVAGLDQTWHSAFLVSRGGEKIAIVGRFDAENVNNIGGYDKVVAYDQSIRPALVETITGLKPRSIALNYSQSDPAADGLTHGMYLYLQDTLKDTPYANSFASAEKVVAALRGRKSPAETELIRAAVQTTERLFDMVTNRLAPGQSEREIAGWLHDARKQMGLGTAWDAPYCPVVNSGPDSPVGHASPGDFLTRQGWLLHMDFGVKQDGFCSDLQRMWYFLEPGESAAPAEVMRAWDACWGAVDAGAEKLRPGARGWEVDAAAREYLTKAGFPEYMHGLGHHLGRVAHDGSTLLGPRWDRYGQTPYGVVEEGNVFTLELGTAVPGRGYVGLEEDVLVTANGIEWLSKPERELWLV